MNKKIISLVLALVMVLGTFTSVFAEPTKKADAKKAEASEKVEKIVGKDNKIQYIIDKKFVEGYEDGSYGLDKNIKRSEITRLLVLANGNEELSKQLQGAMQVYNDVKPEHWANGVITVGTTVPSDANGIAMLAGYPDGSFKPENDVTYAELAKMLVVLAKEDLTADMVKNAVWASSWMTWAAELGILDDVTIADSNKAANRADAFTMIYNALYKMQEFKRVPANETRGIVSNLTNSKLTLNQDKDKEYKITSDTVIVDGNNTRRQIVKVKTVDNLDLYKGSLVRILTNDKNEVTHILELGNPEELAISNHDKDREYKEVIVNYDNNVWEGVADSTIKTAYYKNIVTMEKRDQKDVDKSYATIDLNGSQTKGKWIKFHGTDGKVVERLKINDKTEVYVANPYNNIMKEVKDINEALSLIGFHNYKDGYKIPNVYAGFDNDDHKSAVKGFDSDRNTARVIVFNVVSKDNDGDRYRVINSSSSKYSTTLEDVDGKLYDRDNVLNKANFPLNYGDKNDVIEVRGDVIEKVIDHSETKDYPVVKVEKIYDNDEIKVVDRFDNETLLYVADADIFNAKQYKDLERGDYLQFAANDHNARDIDAVSILGDTPYARDMFEESGSVLKVVKGIEGHTVIGRINWVGEKEVEIRIESDAWDSGLNHTTKTYKVDRELADALKAYVGKEVKFKAENKKHENDVRAYDFMLNDGKGNLIAPKAAKTAIQKELDKFYQSALYSADVTAAKNAINALEAPYADKKAAKEEIDAYMNNEVKKARDAVTAAEGSNFSSTATRAEVDAAKTKVAEAQKAIDALKDSIGKDALQARLNTFKNGALKTNEEAVVNAERKKAYDEYYTAIQTKLATVEYKDSSVIADKEANIKAAVKAALDTVEGKGTYEIASVDVSTGKVTVKVKPLYTGVTASADLTQTLTAK